MRDVSTSAHEYIEGVFSDGISSFFFEGQRVCLSFGSCCYLCPLTWKNYCGATITHINWVMLWGGFA